MDKRNYQYFWDEQRFRFILLVNGEELDEFRTEKVLKMFAINAIKIEKNS